MSKHLAKYVVVEWQDSGGKDGVVWEFKDEWEIEPHTCYSVGVLVADTKEKLVIAQSWNDDQWGRLFVIPRRCVVSIERLELAAASPSQDNKDTKGDKT